MNERIKNERCELCRAALESIEEPFKEVRGGTGNPLAVVVPEGGGKTKALKFPEWSYVKIRGNEQKICWACTAKLQTTFMEKHGTAAGWALYLIESEMVVVDWTGQLRFKVLSTYTTGHNWRNCKTRHVWFIGPDRREWYARQVEGPMSGNLLNSARRLKRGADFTPTEKVA